MVVVCGLNDGTCGHESMAADVGTQGCSSPAEGRQAQRWHIMACTERWVYQARAMASQAKARAQARAEIGGCVQAPA